jgi:hypothetical protein
MATLRWASGCIICAAPMPVGAAQHDYVSMDTEHSGFTVQEAMQICIAC